MSGWIKLHRQFLTHGHFHMPDRALKIWLYILLSVSHQDMPAAGLKAGEAWISYDQIAADCGEAGKSMRREAVARELRWLEEHGYIRRVVIKGRGQKIIVPNWHKYQGSEGISSASESAAEPRPELRAELPPSSGSDSELTPELVPELVREASSETEPTPELTAELVGDASSVPEPAAELAPELKQEDQEWLRRSSTSSPVGHDDDRPTAQGQIAELVAYYREVCRAKSLQRDYAFMGRLYNTYPIDRIYEAIDATALQIAAGQQLDDPLRYVAGVLRNPPRVRGAPFVRARPRDTQESVRQALARLEAMDKAAGEV